MTWPLKTKFYLEKDGEKCFWVVEDSGRIDDRIISGESPLGKCLLEAKPGKFSFKQPDGRVVKYHLLKIEVPHPNHNEKRKEVRHPNQKQQRKEVPNPNHKQNRKEIPHSNHNQGRKEVPDPNHKRGRKVVTVCIETEKRKKDIKERILARGIQYLVHFTPLSNLNSIIRYGLLPRKALLERGFPFDYSDEQRIDGFLNCISTSVSFPNYKMFFKKRHECSDKTWAVIKIEKQALWELQCLFFKENAASSGSMAIPAADLYTIDAFDKMFYEEESRSLIPDSFTTNPQAEVMVHGAITSSYIKGVALESENDRALIQDVKGLPEIEINKDLFSPRRDYRYWLSV